MTGIGYGSIGENGIGGSTSGGIGVGGIGVGPIGGGTAGHVSSSIGDSYQIERVNLPAVLEDSYGIAVSATVADSYRVHVAPTINSAYSIALASARQAAYNIEVASRIGDAYRVSLRAAIEGQYGIGYGRFSHSINGSYQICRAMLSYTTNYPEEYRYRQDFTIPFQRNDSTRYNYVFGQTAITGVPCLTIYRCDGVNTQHELYVGKNCRSDFGDLYFYDTYHGRRMPHLLWRLRYDAGKQAEAVDVSIVLVNSTLYFPLTVRVYYGLDRVDPSPAWPTPPPGFGVCDFSCAWGALTPKYSYPNPTGYYDIKVSRPAIGRYQIHLAKIMEG